MAKPKAISIKTNTALFNDTQHGDVRTVANKQPLRDLLAAQVDDYVARGGYIEFVESPSSVTPSMKAGFQDAARY